MESRCVYFWGNYHGKDRPPKDNLFHGLSSEDPYAHLATYFEICNTVKIAGVSEDAIQLNLLSFSLVGEAKRWLHSFKGNSLRTWEEVVEIFLKKYFPESKTAEGKAEISSFHQFPDESLSEALDFLCGLLQKTTTHGFKGKIKLKPLHTSKGATSLTIRAKVGGPILGIISTRIKEVHPIDLIIKMTTKLKDTLTKFMQVCMSNHKSTELEIKNLEVQVGQLAKQLAKNLEVQATSESDMRQWFKENYNFVISQESPKAHESKPEENP
ncbi:hypothetical protein HKD37_10G028003 [Glycine soja]